MTYNFNLLPAGVGGISDALAASDDPAEITEALP